MKPLILLAFFLSFMATQAFPQQNQWLNFTFTNAVRCIEHEGDYWWLGTEGGLVKFDENSKRIQVFNRGNSNILANHIYSIDKDENGNLWLGTYYGVSKFDGQNFTNYTKENANLLDNNIKHLAYETYGGLWVVTDSALTFFDGNQWQHFRVDNDGDSLKYISAIYAASSAGLLFAINSKVEFIRNSDGVISDMGFGLYNRITGVGFDYMNNVVVTSDNGFWIYGNNGWEHYDHTNTPMPTSFIVQLTVAPNGDLYFNHGQQGVSVRHPDNTWNIIPSQDGDPLNYLLYVYAEDKIALSLQAPFGGMVIADHPDEWTYTFSDNFNLNISPIHSNNVNTMVIANGKKYIATEGIDVLDENNHLIRKYDVNDGEFYSLWNPTKYLAVDAFGNIWCADDLNVSFTKITSDHIELVPGDSLGITNAYVTGLQWETNRSPDGRIYGTLWASFRGSDYQGLAYLDSIWHKFPNEHPQYPSEFNAFTRDENGTLWFADFNVYSYDGQQFTRYWSEAPIKEATSVVRDTSGNLWFGGKPNEGYHFSGGLMKYDGSNWTLFTSENSTLPDDYVTSLAIDTCGNIWIGTFSGGVAEILPDESMRIFNRENSPLDNNTIEKIVIDPATNDVWILNRGAGVFVFNEQGITGIKTKEGAQPLPVSMKLYGNYPNPFNPRTTIRYRINRSGFVKLQIFDINGRLVKTLVEGFERAGEHRVAFDGSQLASGIYLCRLSNGSLAQVIKMALVK